MPFSLNKAQMSREEPTTLTAALQFGSIVCRAKLRGARFARYRP